MKIKLLLILVPLSIGFLNAQDFELDTQLFASGLNQPIGIENAGDNRLFAIEKGGTISIINPDGSVETNKFLDISSQVSTDGERGLLGLAFHPDYINNGFFYVNYTDDSGGTVISRFSVDLQNTPNNADESSELQFLTYAQPATNHNGGDITFGPDDMLYIASGDGGGGGDPNNRAQSLDTHLGKILRLNVDIPLPHIPNDNPFVNDGDPDTFGEIWAIGLRNPFRISFDDNTGDFWIADVGENDFEEVNKVSGNPSALNYGWHCYEGNSVFNMSGNCPSMSEVTFPFADYAQANDRASVTGGYVYRGTAFPSLQGIYIFSDFISDELASIDSAGNLEFFDISTGGSFAGFGSDINNELYAASIGGNIYKIIDTNELSVPEDNFSEEVTLFPNPASQQVFIDLQSASAEINIFNIKGQQVLKKTVSNSEAITISNLSNGLYIVSIKDNGKTSFKKLIVSN